MGARFGSQLDLLADGFALTDSAETAVEAESKNIAAPDRSSPDALPQDALPPTDLSPDHSSSDQSSPARTNEVTLAVQEPAAPIDSTAAVPSTLLIIDTETTGLDPVHDHCLEVGAILFSVPARSVLAQHSFLLPVDSNAAESINRIPASVTRLPQPWQPALRYFISLLEASELMVAHNAAFDRAWFGRGELPSISHRWLCTMEDMRWPPERQLRSRPSVRDLALAYDIPVWAAHRALTDCIYLAEVFRRCDDLEALLMAGLEPRRLMRARVSYDDRQLAREAGFRWNDPVKGAWTRRLSAREEADLSFPVDPVERDAR